MGELEIIFIGLGLGAFVLDYLDRKWSNERSGVVKV